VVANLAEVALAPPLSIARFGLLDAALVVDHTDERFALGLMFPPESCADAALVAMTCGFGDTDEIQRIAIEGTPTGGTFTLSFSGSTTAPIPWNATAAQVTAALEALPTIGAGNVTASGGPLPGTPIDVTFIGALAGRDVAAITGSGALLTKDVSFADGVSTDTSATYTSATAAFTAADVGKGITGTNIPIDTTIASVTNPTTVELSQAATGTGTGLSFTIVARAGQGAIIGTTLTPGVPLPDLPAPVARDGYRNYEPFTAIAADRCSAFGWAQADYEGRARRLLAARESKAAEVALWSAPGLPAANPRLVAGVAVTTLGTSLARRLALATLVQGLADRNAGRGMIHARPRLVEAWGADGMLRIEGGKLVTTTGHLVIAGTGYPGTGPAAQAVAGTVEWAYATDAVVVHRGPVALTPRTMREATNSETNTVTFRAERGLAPVFAGCALVAVSVDVAVS
jgi:hypothetical protein